MKKLKIKIQEAINAAEILLDAKLYRQAATKYWEAARSAIFYHLKEKDISYSSTKEALQKIVLEYNNSKLSDTIIFIEAIGTLSEWDEYFQITKEQIIDFKDICIEVVSNFIFIEVCKGRFKNEYKFIEEEIIRHREDAKYAMATHYNATTRNEKYHSCFLRWGFILTLLGISCFLCSFSNYFCFCKDWVGQSITLIGACVTLWPLIKDYSGKAVRHRQSADEYNSIFKKCNNWKSDFPNMNAEARHSVLLIRNSIILINTISPNTEKSDYEEGKKNIDSGSYNYDNLISKNDKKYLQSSNTQKQMENKIAEKQNGPEAIQLLKAQRVAYTCSKRWGYIDVFIALASLIFYICYVSAGLGAGFIDIYKLIPCAGAYIVMFIVYKVQKRKTLIGALIQEKFDNEVFDLPQSKILTPTYPSIEIIANYAYKYKRNDISNWYMDYLISDQLQPIAVLRCQLSSLLWDKVQRQAFKSVMVVLTILIAVVFLIISYVNNYPFQELLKLLIIISPAFLYLIKNIIGQSEMIKNKDDATNHIFTLLNKYYKESSIPTETELRDIQNIIYNQRTQIQYTISDLWYRMKKKTTEKYLEQVFHNLK